MASKLTPIQIRYSDPRINTYVDVLSKANSHISKSKLLENITKEPIERAFKAWLIAQRAAGLTYSALSELTDLPVPDLMGMVEPGLALDEDELQRHLTLVGHRLGVDFPKIWNDLPAYELGPI